MCIRNNDVAILRSRQKLANNTLALRKMVGMLKGKEITEGQRLLLLKRIGDLKEISENLRACCGYKESGKPAKIKLTLDEKINMVIHDRQISDNSIDLMSDEEVMKIQKKSVKKKKDADKYKIIDEVRKLEK